jgi:nitrite reductase/ring-hydroxylating ferredoxin subunit
MPRWVTVMRAEDLPPDRPITVRVNERELALADCSQENCGPHLLDNRCPHRGGQLGDGSVRGDDIICPLHEYDYDLSPPTSRMSRPTSSRARPTCRASWMRVARW